MSDLLFYLEEEDSDGIEENEGCQSNPASSDVWGCFVKVELGSLAKAAEQAIVQWVSRRLIPGESIHIWAASLYIPCPGVGIIRMSARSKCPLQADLRCRS